MPERKHRFITSPRSSENNGGDLISIVLLSEKAGYRMKSYGPTALMKIGNSRIIDVQLQSIKSSFKKFEIIICCGFGCDKIAKYVRENYPDCNIRVVENQVHHHSNSCESVRLCLNNITNSKVLICDGDLLLSSQNILTPVSLHSHSYMLYSHRDLCSKNLEVGMVINRAGYIENICYGIPNVWCELVFLHDYDTIEYLRKILSGPDYKTKFLFEALNDLNKTKHQLKAVKQTDGTVVKIDNIKTYHEIRRKYEGSTTKLHYR